MCRFTKDVVPNEKSMGFRFNEIRLVSRPRYRITAEMLCIDPREENVLKV